MLLRRVRAVLPDDLERPPIHVLDRADVDAASSRVLPASSIDAPAASLTSSSACRLSRARDPGAARYSAPGKRAERDLRHDAERAFRSDEEIDRVHVGRGVIAGRAFRDLRHLDRSASSRARGRACVSTSNRPSRAAACPRATSSTVPSASTTVSASTQSRVLPYLKVAAPAALVATMPPALAPVNVGAGGNHAPLLQPFLHRRDRHAWLDCDSSRLHVDDARSSSSSRG